jgi:hypothetical protein
MAALVHVAVGLAAKPASSRVPVGISILAAEFLDILAILFGVLGIETMQSSPYSHGLLMAAAWSITFGLIAGLIFRSTKIGAFLGTLVFSHWMIDFITHPMGAVFGGRPLPPDLPLLFGGSPRVGIGLYNYSLTLAYAVEYGSIAIGIAVYVVYLARNRRSRRQPAE